jgi:hypothetical protein
LAANNFLVFCQLRFHDFLRPFLHPNVIHSTPPRQEKRRCCACGNSYSPA